MTRRKLTAGARVAKGGTVEALLAAVEADPADRGAREVYGDALLERADPRGELVALQLKRGDATKPTARERELLKAHWAEWLGPLAPLLDKRKSKFERGFLHTAVVNAYREAMPPSLLDRPEWRTVEVLSVVGLGEFGHETEPAALVARIPHLRELAVDTEALPTLPRHAGLRVLEVFVGEPSFAPVVAVFRAKTFPNVTTLRLTNHAPNAKDLDAILGAAKLRELELPVDRAGGKLVLDLASRLEALVVSGRWGEARVTAAGPPAKRHLTVALRSVEANGVPALTQLLRDLGPRVTVRVDAGGARAKAALRELGALGFATA